MGHLEIITPNGDYRTDTTPDLDPIHGPGYWIETSNYYDHTFPASIYISPQANAPAGTTITVIYTYVIPER